MIRTCPYCGNTLDVDLEAIEENEDDTEKIYHVKFVCFRDGYVEYVALKEANHEI